MNPFLSWSRREFITCSVASVIATHCSQKLFGQVAGNRLQSAVSSPEETMGNRRPLLTGNTARSSRYAPDGGDFVIRNGKEYFNRPLYGPNNAFRLDAGDLPEFSLYLPGHGGNLRLGISVPAGSKWLFQAAEITARYRPGRMVYEIRDPFLGEGSLSIEVFTASEGSGVQLRVQANNAPAALSLLWSFGGVSGRKGKRGGDIGCESEPVSSLFQLRPEECAQNSYRLHPGSSAADNGTESCASATLQSPAAHLQLLFPGTSVLQIADASAWDADWSTLSRSVSAVVSRPVLIGSVAMTATTPVYIAIHRVDKAEELPQFASLSAAFTARSEQISAIAATLQVDTPDPHINAAAGALSIAADAIWDSGAKCVMHGAVAWRVPLAGWRGPYVLSSLGQHARMRQHLRHWIGRQNTTPVSSAESPAIGPCDSGSHLTRKENMLHSRGDLSHNHYDMNLVFFDVLLRHLQWTGDLEFAREIWPALLMHLDWERRLFRRTYQAGGRELPLYEAYACIWASDNLQYNGAGVAHSSAYNYYANHCAATIARLIGEDPTRFDREASLILEGMQQLLWLPEKGTLGESKDILASQTVYTSPALWTFYHAIDSEVLNPRQSWQMAAERLAALRHVRVHGAGVPAGEWFMLSCSDWLPYVWSLNLLILAENMHTALALWQTGMREEAFEIFKGNLIDSMFQGLCPGNFHMSSELDVHRQESQRDFGDPIGITSRAFVEGLFGLKPDLLRGVVTVRPGFPGSWDHASLHHPDMDLVWHREGSKDVFEITSRFPRPISLALVLSAPRTGQPRVLINGAEVEAHFDKDSVGVPTLLIAAPAASHWAVEVHWRGKATPRPPAYRSYRMGQSLVLPEEIRAFPIDDPQKSLRNGRCCRSGFHVLFARIHQEDSHWWMPITFEVKEVALVPPNTARIAFQSSLEHVDLSAILRHNVTDIFRRSYVAPRSPYCSLAIPEQGLGGWAAFDEQRIIDDSGIRSAGGLLPTPLNVSFRTPAKGGGPNCLFLSQWEQDKHFVDIPLSGHASKIFLLMAGTTFPQASRMVHGVATAHYADGSTSELILRNPDNWWPIEQDYLLDDYLFTDSAPIPPRVDLRTGQIRLLDPVAFRGQGGMVAGGSANILELPLDPAKALVSLRVEAKLYGIVMGLLSVTLVRSS